MNITPDFQQFWDGYGLKRDRIAAERAWKRLSAKDRRAAMAGITAYRGDCLRRGVSMMYAQGYLNHRRWEDEPDVAVLPAVATDGGRGQWEQPSGDTVRMPSAEAMEDIKGW